MKSFALIVFTFSPFVCAMEKPEETSPYLKAIVLRTYTNNLTRLTKTRVIPEERKKTILEKLSHTDKELGEIAQLANQALAHDHQRAKEQYEQMQKLEDQARQRLFLISGPLDTLEKEVQEYPIKAKL